MHNKSRYTKVTFLDSHVDWRELNDYVNSILDNKGMIGRYMSDKSATLTIDFPTNEKNRTKRFFVTLGEDTVTIRYFPKRLVRLRPYHEAVDKLVEMIKDDSRRKFRSEGASYDESVMPLMIDMSPRP